MPWVGIAKVDSYQLIAKNGEIHVEKLKEISLVIEKNTTNSNVTNMRFDHSRFLGPKLRIRSLTYS